MKKALLVVVVVCASAQLAAAQVGRQRAVVGDTQGRVRSSRGHGFAGGYGTGAGFTFVSGTYYGGWYGHCRPAWGWGYPYYPHYRYEPYETLGYGDYLALNYITARRAQIHGVPERTQRIALSKEIEAGLQRWRKGDYAGALASFKEAVGVDTSNGLAQVYMGLALVAVGDLPNAEKAIASGLPSADLTGVQLTPLFVRSGDLARFWETLAKAPSLTCAVGLLLMGETDKARAKAAEVQGPAKSRLDDLLRARVTGP